MQKEGVGIHRNC